jgi:CubicO group peptidase (beta-lactamase class C family)
MAIEHRAIFALSIAFTASIVAFPDLPADIPPRAGFDGPFVGAPFVAFFLPLAALAMWWLVDSASRQPAQSAGAATALFLSAFHVTMLIAFIGGQPWLGRILGAMVGAFLIATGNAMPRVRPNLTWGIRTSQTLQDEDLWRRVHRLTGYIRVLTGLAICITALAGLRWLTQLIVAAVTAETVAGVAASVLLSQRRSLAIGFAMCLAGATGTQAQTVPPDRIAADRIATLPALIDATVPKLLEQQHIAGTAVAVVHDGRVLMTRGYGRARLTPDVPVDPDRTLFRVGSVTKVFTGAAALQLVDAGKLDLQKDIRTYLPDVPLRYGTTTHQLLTHTAGFDERFAGAYTDAGHVVPLAEHLRLSPPQQVIRPGRAYSYSNYNYAVAGLVIEARSGLTFERYLDERVFGPLKMTASTAHQPSQSRLAANLSRGYRWTGDRHQPLEYRYTYASPSGAIATSAADMGRFMIALLNDGVLDGTRVLSPASAKALLAAQFTPDPRIPATTYGFSHLMWHGRRLVIRGGTLGDQAGMLILMPEDRLGIFVASNSLPGLGDFLYAPMMTHLFGAADPPLPALAPRPGAHERAARLAGTYRDYHHTRNDMSRVRALMPFIQGRLTVDGDGALRWRGARWLEVEPSVFRREDALEYIVFRNGERADATELHGANGTYERIGWLEQSAFHAVLLVACVVAFVAYAGFRLVRLLRRRPSTPDGRMAGRLAAFVATTNLLFLFALAPTLRDLGAVTPLPWPQLLILSLPLVSLVATALLPGFAARAWIAGWWTRRERLGYSAVAALSVAFMTFLNYWKLLGMRY